MSSMPAPIETEGPGTRGRTDTSWQSIIVVAECLSSGFVSTHQPSSRGADRPVPDLDLLICPPPFEALRSIIDGTRNHDHDEPVCAQAGRGDAGGRDHRAATTLAGDLPPASAR
jgi:hypothetical protein